MGIVFRLRGNGSVIDPSPVQRAVTAFVTGFATAPDFFPGSNSADGYGSRIDYDGVTLVVATAGEQAQGASSQVGTAYIVDPVTLAVIHPLYDPKVDVVTSERWWFAIGPSGISGNTIIVGSLALSGNTESGRLIFFDKTTGGVIREIVSPYTGGVDRSFGAQAVAGGGLVATNGGDGDRVYIYNVSTGALVREIINPNGGLSSDSFGETIAISGDIIYISAPSTTTAADDEDGIVYAFNISTGNLLWSIVNPNTGTGDSSYEGFGGTIVVDGNFLVVSHYYENRIYNDITQQPGVYVYNKTTGAFVRRIDSDNPLDPVLGTLIDGFGSDMSLDGNNLYISGTNYFTGNFDFNAKEFRREVYIYDILTGTRLKTLQNENATGEDTDDSFGIGLVAKNGVLYVGARRDRIHNYDINIQLEGTVYRYLVEDSPGTSVRYSIIPQNYQYTTDEAVDLTLIVRTIGVPEGTVLQYTITGISPADLVGGSLTGTVTIGEDGTGLIILSIADDLIIEGPEMMTIALDNGQATTDIQINDTSAPPPFESGWRIVMDGATIRDATYIPSINRYVAVGTNGTVWRSANGSDWFVCAVLPPATLTGIAYSGSELVVTSTGTATYRSTDGGLTWTSTTIGATFVNAIVWTGTQFVIVGNSNYTAWSTNGVSWTAVTAPGTAVSLFDVAVRPETRRLIAVGSSGRIISTQLTNIPTTGLTWTQVTSNTTNTLNGVEYANGSFVCVGNSGTIRLVNSELNIVNSVTSGTTAALFGVTALRDRFVALGSNVLLTSNSGVPINWTVGTFPVLNTINRVRRLNNQLFALTNPGHVLRSTNGLNWTIVRRSANTAFDTVIWTGSRYIAADGFGGQSTSTDGVYWSINTNFTTPLGGGGITKIIKVDSTLYALGTVGRIFRSTDDGVTWTGGAPNGVSSTAFDDMIWTGEAFYIIGNGGVVLRSTDSFTWAQITTPTTDRLVAGIYTQSIFVIVGRSGRIITSTDGGLTWAIRSSTVANNIESIAWSGSRFVAGVASNGLVVTSTDGITWSSNTAITTASQTTDVLWTGSEFIASGSTGAIATSPDGLTWTQTTPLPSKVGMRASVANGGQVVMVGDLGTILLRT
jgi:hypothetical protein